MGDIANKGKEAEFELVHAFLERLWQRWESKRWNPKLLAVPGNHDLTRPKSLRAPHKDLLSSHRKPTVGEVIWGEDPDDRYRPIIEKGFANYLAWWEEQGPRRPAVQEGDLPGEFCAVIPGKGGQKLGIMGLNNGCR